MCANLKVGCVMHDPVAKKKAMDEFEESQKAARKTEEDDCKCKRCAPFKDSKPISKLDAFKIRNAPRQNQREPIPRHAIYANAIKDHLKAEAPELDDSQLLSDYEIGHLASMMTEVERVAEERGAKEDLVNFIHGHSNDIKTIEAKARAEAIEECIAALEARMEQSKPDDEDYRGLEEARDILQSLKSNEPTT